MSIRAFTIALVSAVLVSSCGPGETNSTGAAGSGEATSTTPLQALLECDPARDASAASGMRLAAEYGNGKFYLPNEPTQAFGMPVVGLLIYSQRYWFGQPMGANANVMSGAPEGIYTVTFVDVPGADAARVLTSWGASHGYSETGGGGDEDGNSTAVTWLESSALQSVSPDAMPADVVELVRRVGSGAIEATSALLKGGEGESVPVHVLWAEATESGEISAVHCPGNNITGLF